MINILFVCLGNICRSPAATGIFKAKVERAGLAGRIDVQGAGTGDWHVGLPPDGRMMRAAADRGYDLSRLRARQVDQQMIARAHYVFAMDAQNLADLQALAGPEHASKLRLFLDVEEASKGMDVPDPYYGDAHGFTEVLDLCEKASDALLDLIRKEHDVAA